MPKIPVNSKLISSIYYQPDSESLDINFQTSKTRVYHEVPSVVVDTLLSSDSPGWYYTRNIKGCYPLFKT